MDFDISRARRETPGCEQVLHFNNAGAALMPQPVIDALHNHLDLEARIGGYEAHAAADEAYKHTNKAIARLLNCSPTEIALVENSTRAWDMAFYGLRLGAGDRILTAQASYASNYLAMLQVQRNTGAEIVVIPNDETGQVSLDALNERIDERTRLIALTHVPTNSGLVNPAEEVGQIARDAGVPYLLDACQSAGQLPLDVERLGCDFLSATGRKFLRGPRGTGFLYVRGSSLDLLEPPFIDLHAATWTALDDYKLQPGSARFENWEGYVAGKIALGVAVDYALDWGTDSTWNRLKRLAADLRDGLGEIPGITVHDIGRKKGGIVTFSHSSIPSPTLKSRLAQAGINVTTSIPEYARLDTEARGLPETVRASVHYYNTDDEVVRLCDVLRSIVSS